MKKAILTIGLFSLVMILTSFTAPEVSNNTKVDNNTNLDVVGGISTGYDNVKVDIVGQTGTKTDNPKVDIVGQTGTKTDNPKVD